MGWVSLLDKVVEGFENWPSMSKREMVVAVEELDLATEPLKQALDDLDAIYHAREEAPR